MNKLKWVCLLILPMLLTGCWDSVEINERHVVLEIAIDKNMLADLSKPFNEQERYEITYTIPDIGKLSGNDSLAADIKVGIKTTSPTIATSIDEVETKTQKTVTFSHTKAIVLGEELLKDRDLLKAAIDGLMRSMQISRSTVILAAKGKAGEVTQLNNPQNPIMGLYVMKYFNNRERPTSYAKEQLVGSFIKELEDTGISTIPVIGSGGEDTVQISGAAVIRDYELTGWLDKEAVRGELFVEGKIKEVPIVIDYNNEYLTYNIEKQDTKIRFKQENHKWNGYIEVNTKGNIIEYISRSSNNIFDKGSIEEISKLLEQEITKQVMVAVSTSKAMNVDFLNVGLEMYRKHPGEWKNYYNSWHQGGYQDFPISIITTATIQNTGILE